MAGGFVMKAPSAERRRLEKGLRESEVCLPTSFAILAPPAVLMQTLSLSFLSIIFENLDWFYTIAM